MDGGTLCVFKTVGSNESPLNIFYKYKCPNVAVPQRNGLKLDIGANKG